jgi:preprotein translocase subunit SecD
VSRQYRTIIIIAVIVIIAIWLDLPNNLSLFGRPNVFTHLGLDLVGGVQALLEADVPAGTTVDPTSMNTAIKIVENRVNGLGVSEAVVQKAGSQRIVVEIPGVKDPQQAIATIKTTGLLEFVDMSSCSPQAHNNLLQS